MLLRNSLQHRSKDFAAVLAALPINQDRQQCASPSASRLSLILLGPPFLRLARTTRCLIRQMSSLE
jgi:hypothetical protein